MSTTITGPYVDKEINPLHYITTQTTLGNESGDEQRTLWQNVVKYRKVAFVTFGLTSAILLHGYDAVVVGATSGMPMFVYVPFATSLCFLFFSTISGIYVTGVASSSAIFTQSSAPPKKQHKNSPPPTSKELSYLKQLSIRILRRF